MPTSASFMEIGVTSDNFTLKLPWPSIGAMAFSSTPQYATVITANNVTVGQKRGRTKGVQEIGWHKIKAETWWEINRWFDAYGHFFYCRYFDHTTGNWVVRRFRNLGPSGTADTVSPTAGAPAYYYDAVLAIEDTGG